jgi:hypothetical protein
MAQCNRKVVGLWSRGMRLGLLLLALLFLPTPAVASAQLSWSSPLVLDQSGRQELVSVACASTSQCTAVDFVGQEVTFNPSAPGNSTSAPIFPSVCTSIFFCRSTSTDTCISATECVAGTTNGMEVTFDPASGQKLGSASIDSGNPFISSIACPAANECVVVDEGGHEVKFDPSAPGNTTAVSVDSDALASVACVNTTECVAVDTAGREVEFNPSSPTPTPEPIDSQDLTGVACLTTSECVAVDDNGGKVEFNPLSPGSPTVVAVDSANTELTSVACPASNECVAVDVNGAETEFAPTATGGTPSTIDSNQQLASVACPKVSMCVAVDDAGQEVTFEPVTPGSPTPVTIDKGAQLSGVACLSGSECVAVDDDGNEVSFDPASGVASASATIDSGHGLNGVACIPASGVCVAVDGDGREVTFDPDSGATTVLASIDTASLLSVACPSTNECVALDSTRTSGNEVTFNPGSGTAQAPAKIDTTSCGIFGCSDLLDGLACESVSECTAVDNNGRAITFDPANGTNTISAVDSGNSLESVACPSSDECAAVDFDGNEVQFDPSFGSPPVVGTVDPGNLLKSVACPSSNFCVAVDLEGNAVEGDPGNPAGWILEPISDAVSPDAVSCSSPGQCVAVDSVGHGFVGTAAPVNVSPPGVGGTALQGTALSEVNGSWANNPTSFSHQWEDCDASGNNCAAIPGATSGTYVLGVGDVGHTIRVEEFATNAGGTGGPVSSAPTAVVVATPPTGPIGSLSTSGTTLSFNITCTGNPGQTCSESVTGTTTEKKRGGKVIAVAARSKGKKHKKPVKTTMVGVSVIAASFTVPAGATVRETASLDHTGQKLLSTFYSLPVSLSFTGTTPAGETVTFSYPRILSHVSFTWFFNSSFTTVQALTVHSPPSRAKVIVLCHGGGCPFGRRVGRKRAGQVALAPLFHGAHLSPGTMVTVEVTAQNKVGKVLVFKINSGNPPSEVERCLPPGVRNPVACA